MKTSKIKEKIIRTSWEIDLIKKHHLELLYYAGKGGEEIDNLFRDIRNYVSLQRQEIIEEIKKDLDAGMFDGICSNEETFMRYLKQKLTK